jgi:hypothetical protein
LVFFSKKNHLRCCDSGFILFCLVLKTPCHTVGWVLFALFCSLSSFLLDIERFYNLIYYLRFL